MKIGIFTGATSVRSKNIFTDISRYTTGKHEIMRYILYVVCMNKSKIWSSGNCMAILYDAVICFQIYILETNLQQICCNPLMKQYQVLNAH